MALPTGPAVTFLFTDIEGSTRLEQAVGTSDWSALVGRHDELLRRSIETAGGVVVKTEGDAFFAAFAEPASAVRAAADAQRAIAAEDWPDGVTLRGGWACTSARAGSGTARQATRRTTSAST